MAIIKSIKRGNNFDNRLAVIENNRYTESMMSQQSSTAFIIIYLSAMILLVHWSCTRAESSPAAQSNSVNWETDMIATSQSKPSSMSNNLNDISDRLYRLIYKRLTDTTASNPSIDSYGGK